MPGLCGRLACPANSFRREHLISLPTFLLHRPGFPGREVRGCGGFLPGIPPHMA